MGSLQLRNNADIDLAGIASKFVSIVNTLSVLPRY
jgi:hypothetical protein